MKTIICISLLAALLFCQSCATIFSGTTCTVRVNDGTPTKSKVFMNGNYKGITPCNVPISKNGLRNSQTKITIKSDEYKDQDILLVRKLKVAGFIGDCLLGFWPLIIDFSTGAIYKASPDNINYYLDKELKTSVKDPRIKEK